MMTTINDVPSAITERLREEDWEERWDDSTIIESWDAAVEVTKGFRTEGRTWIVLTANTKEGTLYPDIAGPFSSPQAAARYAVMVFDEEVGSWPPGEDPKPQGFRLTDSEAGYEGVIYIIDDAEDEVM